MPLEVLNIALVFLGGGACIERSEIPALPRFGIDLSGVEPEFSGFEFTDHGAVSEVNSGATGR